MSRNSNSSDKESSSSLSIEISADNSHDETSPPHPDISCISKASQNPQSSTLSGLSDLSQITKDSNQEGSISLDLDKSDSHITNDIKPEHSQSEKSNKEDSPSIELGSESSEEQKLKNKKKQNAKENKKEDKNAKNAKTEPKNNQRIEEMEKLKTKFEETLKNGEGNKTKETILQMNDLFLKQTKDAKVGEIIQSCVENVFQMIQKDVLENKSIQMLMQILMQFDACFGNQSFYKSKHQIVVDDVQGKINKIQEQVNNMQVNQVEAVYKELTSMNQIVLFEPNLAKGLDSVLKQFKNQILGVLNAIYIQIKLNPEQLAFYLQNYINFITSISQIPIVRQQMLHVRRNLLGFHQTFCDQGNQLLKLQSSCYQIVQSNHKSKMDYVKDHVQQIRIILNTLTKVVKVNCNNDQQLYQTFNVLITQIVQVWNNQEKSIAEHLLKIVNQQQELNFLNGIQLITLELQNLDIYMNSQLKYQYITQNISALMDQKINLLLNQLTTHLQQQQFDELQEDMNKLNKDEQFIIQTSAQLQQQLEQYMTHYTNGINQLLSQINLLNPQFTICLKKILELFALMYKASQIQNFNGQYLLDQQICSNMIQQCIAKIQDSLQIDEINSEIKQAIGQNQFDVVEQHIILLTKIQGCFKDIITIGNFFQEFISILEQTINQANTQIQQIVDQQQKQYIKCNFSNLNKNIIPFFNSLQSAAQYNNKYTDIYATLSSDLTQTLNRSINQVDNKNSEDIKEYLKLAEKNINLLPADVKNEVLNQITNLKNTLNQKLLQEEAVVQEGTAAKEFREKIDKYVNHANSQTYSILGKFQENLQLDIQKLYEQMIEHIKKNELIPIFTRLPQAWEDFTYYQSELKKLDMDKVCKDKKQQRLYTDPTIKAYCSKIIADLNKAVSLSSSQITQLTNVDDLKNVEPMSKNFDKLRLFLEIACNDSTLGKDMLSADKNLLTQVQNILPKMLLIFNSNTEKFKKSLADVAELKTVLAFAEKASETHKNLLEFSQSEIGSKFKDFQKFQETLSYNQMKQLLFKEIQQNEDQCKNKVFICEQTNSANAQDRDQFYAVIYASFKQVIKYKNVQIHLTGICDISQIEQTCQQQFNEQVDKIFSEVEIQLGKLPSDDRKIQQKFNNLCDNLRSIGVVFEQTQTAQTAKQKSMSVSTIFQHKITDLQKYTDNNKTKEEICNLLIKFKLLAIDVPSYMEFLNKGIDQVLNYVYMSNNGPQRISEMAITLNTHTNAQIAQQIIRDHSKFKSYSTELRNTDSLRFTLDDILDENVDGNGKLKGLRIQEDNAGTIVDTAVNRAEIRKLYADFDTKYWAQVEQYIYKVEDGKKQMKANVNNIKKGQFTTQSKIDVMTYIFTYWTLSNSQDYVGTNNKAESRKKLLQPHAAQVVAIFSLLGIDQSNQLKNQLIQVLTGEGKSVILAVTAIVLAIMGFDVNCACYSEYLSLRDFESFTDLFNAFNVRDNIVYGTFNQMCEKYINEDGEIRKLTEDCILKNKLDAKKNNKMPRQKVLMIDEVDVFFNESFYGSSYRPMARIQNTEIKELLNYIWSNRNEKNLLKRNAIMKSQVYLNCEKSLKGWENLLKEALSNMLADIEQFQGQQYIVHEGLIGYKDQDAISTRIFYGYKTLFAYYQEVENRTIKNEELQRRICLYFNCGSFSYAEIPKQYTYIIGVTGTLDTVSKPEMKLLTDEYNIKKFSYLPSVYGLNKLTFAKDTSDSVKIVEQKEYFLSIVSEITKRRQNNKGIPVLVFFETSAKLDLFYKSREFKNIDNHQQVKLFTEKISPVEKEGVVRQAVTQNTVTLITREFGRGTDFVCFDKTIDGLGGVHVIQTFFSDELSEEKQIKGRTSRQGRNGSYSLVLLDQELEKYGLVTRDIETMKARSQLYSTIDPKRQAYFEGKYPERIRNIKQIKEDHVKTNTFVKSLLGGNINAVKEFMIAENKGYFVEQCLTTSKTLIIMDATGSMGGVIEKTKNTIKTMFTNAFTVLKEQNYDQSFDVMFAAYRSYGDGAMILQSSAWESNPDNLKRFVDTIHADGGWDEEAMEIGLQHANFQLEKGLTQVIVIGDIGPTPSDDVQNRRNHLGEAYWAKTPFKNPTNADAELQKLNANGIKVHAFYVCPSAAASFQHVADQTGGICKELDVNSAQGAENLTHLVTSRIMENIGGEKLLKIYEAKYGFVGK
ncbi:Helicase-related_protein [Hexamita inflata]|uniref:Helicase-related protein n=1 Tax=Hexamita inflata TaxID=28002 RepID=A0AA86V668_9EUKA|nr:Helicase-related protein [Hexamita inflata]